jgi:hypothetical protein
MSASRREKIFMTLLFIVIGLPPGLCSLVLTPAAVAALQQSRLALVPSMLWLAGLAIFAGMLWLLINTLWGASP